jgi:hypothetical protein
MGEYVIGAKKLVGRHIGASDAAKFVIRIAEKLPEVTKIVPCPRNVGIGTASCKRIRFEEQVGGIKVKTSQSRTHQDLRLMTDHPEAVRRAIARAAIREGFQIVNR